MGAAFLFLTGVAYGLMNLGRKASREEMAEKAREFDRDVDKLKLVFAEKKPATADPARLTPQGRGWGWVRWSKERERERERHRIKAKTYFGRR